MSQRFLLDTHVVVALSIQGGIEAMPTRVQRILHDADAELLLSVASEIEVAIKSRLGKLGLDQEEFAAVCASASITSYPIRQHHARRLFDLPMHSRDPFDRLIISTALCDDLAVLSSDRAFRKYRGLRVIW